MNFIASHQFTISLGLLLFVVAIAKGSEPANQLSDAERRAGWRLLFDGKSTNGWRNYKKARISEGWQIQDGAFVRAKSGAGSIVSIEQFDHFELSLEYRIAPGGNSGIMFHVTEQADKPWQSGPEIQIFDNAADPHVEQAGWLYDLYRPLKPKWEIAFEKAVGRTTPDSTDATRPAGEWNHIYLRVAEQGEVAVNGVSYYYFRKGSDEWNERVAKSTFAKIAGFGMAAKGHVCLQDYGNEVAYRNIKVRTVAADGSVDDPVDGQLPVRAKLAFPNLTWEDWSPEDEQGRLHSLRLIELTHAGDGSGRLFAAAQNGMIQVFSNQPHVEQAKMFLDLRPQVMQWDAEKVFDEYGLLGLAFHPNYAKNGQLFVSYNSQGDPHTSYISRFHVSADRPDRADPESEEVLMRLEQPFPNHNGGSVQFGPDGYLYIGLGDGGSRNDPYNLGQDLSTWMGKILRIDVDHAEDGRAYSVPADNPFVGRANAKPEIYAYGFRNIWRIAFDFPSDTLWAADVGQDLWEEVNLVEKGGNYGWSLREGSLLFGNNNASPQDPFIEPVWKYDHRIGVSVTGGHVYRGNQVAALAGMYLYGDYVASKIWALQFDAATGKATGNYAVDKIDRPIVAFGQDADGEVYCLVNDSNGKCIYRFAKLTTSD